MFILILVLMLVVVVVVVKELLLRSCALALQRAPLARRHIIGITTATANAPHRFLSLSLALSHALSPC